MRISDWSSDVCSSDLRGAGADEGQDRFQNHRRGADIGALDQKGCHGVRQDVAQKDAPEGRARCDRSVDEIGRASCRERVCQYVSISVVAGSVKKKLDTILIAD